MALEREQLDLLPQGDHALQTTPDTQTGAPVPDLKERTTGQIPRIFTGTRRIPLRVFLPAVLLLVLVLLGTGVYAIYSIWLVDRATVTIIPVATMLRQRISIDAARGATTPSQAQVLSYSARSKPQTATHAATGVGHRPAVQATGTLFFYNIATYEITIPQGTTFTGKDGVQVATDAAAFVPAGNPPQLVGSTFVSAHAVSVGAAGNISPLDVNSALSGSYNGIAVKNPASFSGGQNAQTYPVVTRADITSAAAPLETSLTQATQSALQAQLGPHEQFLASPSCTPSVQANPAAGQAGSQVSVAVQVSCHADAYNQQQLTRLATTSFTQLASAQLGAGYAPVGSPTTASVQVIVGNLGLGHYTLIVPVSGRFAYQFSRPMLVYLSGQLAGKSSGAASSLLLNTPGIAQATIGLTGWSNGDLPTDTTQIHLVVAPPRSA